MKTTPCNTIFLLESHSYDLDILMHLGFSQDSIDFFLKKTILKRKGLHFEFDFVGFLYVRELEFFVCPKYRKTVYEKSMIPIFKKIFSSFKTDLVRSDNLFSSKELGVTILNDFLKNKYFLEEHRVQDSDWDSVDWDDLISDSENFHNGHLVVTDPQTSSKKYQISEQTKRMQNSFVSYVLLRNPELLYEIRIPSVYLKGQHHTETEMLLFFQNQLKNSRLFREKRMLKFYIEFLTAKQSEFEYLGTKFFHNIWEKICKAVFQDQSHKYKQQFPKPLYTIGEKELKLIGHIPDIISLPDDENCFVLDAKYYNIQKGLPQTEDVTKQLFYEKLCQRLFPTRTLHNAFLFLNEQEEDVSRVGNLVYDVFDEKEIVLYSLKDTFVLSYFCNEKSINPKMLPL